jgi:hypothetical protein
MKFGYECFFRTPLIKPKYQFSHSVELKKFGIRMLLQKSTFMKQNYQFGHLVELKRIISGHGNPTFRSLRTQ